MAAKIEPSNVRQRHQALHHFVADSPWEDDAVLSVCADEGLVAMRHVVDAWIVDDTGMLKKGEHSVGVARQYCGRIGKQDNCQVAVSLSLANEDASIPVAYRLYLPKEWASDKMRRKRAKVPAEISFQTKWEIALDQIRGAKRKGYPLAPVVADAGYGVVTEFREALDEIGLQYAVGVSSTTTVWTRENPPPAPPQRGPSKRGGRPPKLLARDEAHQPQSVLDVALQLPSRAYKNISWRQGTKGVMKSRFAAVRVRAAHRDIYRSEPRDEQWLIIEWPVKETEPTKYWLTNMSDSFSLTSHVALIMMRWRIERDYEELKSELGLAHFEGRSWRGFHHHATLCIAAYTFLVCERLRFSPLSSQHRTGLIKVPAVPEGFQARGAARAA
jgi:SRSO17 transposase